MLLIGEIVLRKKKLEQDIIDYKSYLHDIPTDTERLDNGALYTKVLNRLFAYYNKLQNFDALLDKYNNKTEVAVGDSTISVTDALHLCNTLNKKIEDLACIILKNDYTINVEELMDNKGTLLEELITLRKVINISDWSTEIETTKE